MSTRSALLTLAIGVARCVGPGALGALFRRRRDGTTGENLEQCTQVSDAK